MPPELPRSVQNKPYRPSACTRLVFTLTSIHVIKHLYLFQWSKKSLILSTRHKQYDKEIILEW